LLKNAKEKISKCLCLCSLQDFHIFQQRAFKGFETKNRYCIACENVSDYVTQPKQIMMPVKNK